MTCAIAFGGRLEPSVGDEDELSVSATLLALDPGHELLRALSFTGGMTWEILWTLILGFALSAVVQALVSKREMRRLLPDGSPRTLLVASGLGAASSSCSYASVALSRSLFRKGADFTVSMAFEFASTNLVIELGIIMALILGWQFTLAEYVGGPLMIVALALLFRALLRRRLVDEARREAEKGRLGSMEGHAAMDMAIRQRGSLWRRLASPEGFTATSHVFVMEWAAVLRDIVGGRRLRLDTRLLQRRGVRHRARLPPHLPRDREAFR